MRPAAAKSNRLKAFSRAVSPWLAALLFGWTLCGPAGANGQPPEPVVGTEEDDEENPYRAGLIAHYRGSDGREHIARADQVAFAWHEHSPDRRVPRGPFTATFRGRLQVQSPGIHRLRIFSAGQVRLRVNDQTLIDAHSPTARWHDAKPIELAFGYHAVEIEFRRTDEPGRLALFWEGPGFQLEPVAGRWLHHDASQSPSDEFEQGAHLVRALRCQACHDLPGEAPALKAPALHTLAGNLSRDWLVQWLADAQSAAHRNMPHFQFTPDEATAVADHLLAISKETVAPPSERPATAPPPVAKRKKKDDEPEPPAPEPDAVRGAVLFRSLGCLACHRTGELGTDYRFGGGDLSHVADKRPPSFFRRWLDNPAALNRDHRMPVFALERVERESLSLYLESLRGKELPVAAAVEPQAERGRALVAEARCAACHTLEATSPTPAVARIPLDLKAVASKSLACLSPAEPASRRPYYRLSESETKAVAGFLSQLPPDTGEPIISGHNLLVERNCLACHARDGSSGLTAQMPSIAEADSQLAPVLAALTPPSLLSVGDKLHDAALLAAITVSQPPRQTWLRVRMPKFPFTADKAQRIATHLIEVDRIPDRPETRNGDANVTAGTDSVLAAQEAAGPRLVTADGFGCTSCHAIGKWQPQKVALNAQGANLSQLGDRVRRAWFDRWVRNPARIIPQMEMPAVQQAVRGVLDGHLDQQLAAVWRVLNRPGFTPPSPSALRVVRRSNRADIVEPAAVLTDVVEVDGKQFVKPLIVGLANRHNVLYDLASGRLAAWWLGDAARQQTRGKSWFWEAGVPQLLDVEKPDAKKHQCELRLVGVGASLDPITSGDYLTEFDRLDHVPGGLRFEHRLRFAADGSSAITLRLAQTFTTLAGERSQSEGFSRQLQIEGVPDGRSCQLLVLPGRVTIDADGRAASLAGRAAQVHVQLIAPAGARLIPTERGAAVLLASNQNRAECTLQYRSDVAADQFAPLPVADRSLEPQTLDVVPGFDAVRLRTTDQAMPTGLAWRPDGALIVTSLEGRVWLGHDTDRDGLIDRLDPFSDELAAPFGVAASGQVIDVINKYGLLRLTDADRDGHAEQMQLLASGWGHTRDYHDWAVGLPRDSEGNYYVSLPCQQDERTAAGALLRGTVVKLVPRQPTSDDPRGYAIDPLCAGLRFPQGIALSPENDLFVTDNQGNYTPFNELNHVVRGARYGFINRLENKPGFAPPFQPAAVEIPHPWTRSVNGICFLALPSAATQTSQDKLGPFAGHLVGCEYDTRRLVRMSLERVGGEFQGAVYPFSREPAAGEATFEGPLTCAVSPEGDVYIGNIRDSGWGAGANTGSLVRLRYRGQPAPGIAEVRSIPGGFAIAFTTPVDPAKARDAASYSIASYRRIPTPDYGGADRDRRVERVHSIELSPDGKRATLLLGELREGFVYEFHLRNLANEKSFFPAEAYYTLRHVAR